MNEHSPKRFTGSLIQRAVAMMPGLPAEEAPATAQPAPPVPDRPLVPIDRNRLAAAGMLVPGGPITPLAEEFRMVKRQLLLTARGVAGVDADRARMILVCSAQPDEGKTFCAINLALSMAAEKDVEILLVDADFAKPDVSKRLGMGEGPGLLDALAGQIDVEACIVDTDVPQLAILPARCRGAHARNSPGSTTAASKTSCANWRRASPRSCDQPPTATFWANLAVSSSRVRRSCAPPRRCGWRASSVRPSVRCRRTCPV